MPPGHPCRFPFASYPFFISAFFLSYVVVLRVPIPFLFRLFVVSFSVYFFCRLRFSCRFAAFVGGGFCYPGFSSRCYPAAPPPRGACESEICVFPIRAVFLLACLLLIYVIFLFFIHMSILDVVCFILPFSRGYSAISSVSVSAATRLA